MKTGATRRAVRRITRMTLATTFTSLPVYMYTFGSSDISNPFSYIILAFSGEYKGVTNSAETLERSD
jgi:hypothetical protein